VPPALEPQDGTIAPAGDFIPAAETLEWCAWSTAARSRWQSRSSISHQDVKLSINVSGTTAGDQSWLQSFINYVRENRAVAERMTVELTETAALQAFEENSRFVTRLRDMGCRVAIDDFGAGYTSFRNLHNLHVDMVKIDGAYVKDLSASPDNQLFVRTSSIWRRTSSLKPSPNGSGSEEDAQMLAGFGVDFFQGYYFGEPDIAPDWLNTEIEPRSA